MGRQELRFCTARDPYGFINVIFAWSPFFLLCLYTMIAGAHDLSVFATLIPPMVAKFAPFLNGMAVIFAVPRIATALRWMRTNRSLLTLSQQITTPPRQLWLNQE